MANKALRLYTSFGSDMPFRRQVLRIAVDASRFERLGGATRQPVLPEGSCGVEVLRLASVVKKNTTMAIPGTNSATGKNAEPRSIKSP
jgi:hypothetical protein